MKTAAVIILLVLVPVFLFFWLNLQVSYKYEVDHARTFAEINSKLTPQQKKEQFNEIEVLEEEILSQSNWMLVLASASFIAAFLVAYLPSGRKNQEL